MHNLDKLQSIIGVNFNTPALLRQALVHTSYINENPAEQCSDNQRLEFLGDAVLNFVVGELLFNEFTELPEGKLTEIRVSMVRQDNLSEKAASLTLGDYLLLGKGEEKSDGRNKRNNLADTFEAVTAAIFLDQGIDIVRQFILRQLKDDIESVKSGQFTPNYKALLQEFTQLRFNKLPCYNIIEVSGPEHNRVFTISVMVGKKLLAAGSGKTKKEAESLAAKASLEILSTNWQSTADRHI